MASYGDFSGEEGGIEGDDGDDAHGGAELDVDNYAEMDAEMEIAMNEAMGSFLTLNSRGFTLVNDEFFQMSMMEWTMASRILTLQAISEIFC